MRRGGLIIDAIEGSDLLSEHPRRWAEVIVVGTPDAGSASGGVAGVVPRPALNQIGFVVDDVDEAVATGST